MGLGNYSPLKVYRNVYVFGYTKFPYQKLSGRHTLLYKGKIVCGVDRIPDEYDDDKDMYIDCDCDFSQWRNLKRIF